MQKIFVLETKAFSILVDNFLGNMQKSLLNFTKLNSSSPLSNSSSITLGDFNDEDNLCIETDNIEDFNDNILTQQITPTKTPIPETSKLLKFNKLNPQDSNNDNQLSIERFNIQVQRNGIIRPIFQNKIKRMDQTFSLKSSIQSNPSSFSKLQDKSSSNINSSADSSDFSWAYDPCIFEIELAVRIQAIYDILNLYFYSNNNDQKIEILNKARDKRGISNDILKEIDQWHDTFGNDSILKPKDYNSNITNFKTSQDKLKYFAISELTNMISQNSIESSLDQISISSSITERGDVNLISNNNSKNDQLLELEIPEKIQKQRKQFNKRRKKMISQPYFSPIQDEKVVRTHSLSQITRNSPRIDVDLWLNNVTNDFLIKNNSNNVTENYKQKSQNTNLNKNFQQIYLDIPTRNKNDRYSMSKMPRGENDLNFIVPKLAEKSSGSDNLTDLISVTQKRLESRGGSRLDWDNNTILNNNLNFIKMSTVPNIYTHVNNTIDKGFGGSKIMTNDKNSNYLHVSNRENSFYDKYRPGSSFESLRSGLNQNHINYTNLSFRRLPPIKSSIPVYEGKSQDNNGFKRGGDHSPPHNSLPSAINKNLIQSDSHANYFENRKKMSNSAKIYHNIGNRPKTMGATRRNRDFSFIGKDHWGEEEGFSNLLKESNTRFFNGIEGIGINKS